MTQILITGASGFVGSAIAHRCQTHGWAVRTTGRSTQLRQPLPHYHPADLRNPSVLPTLLQGVESVVHAAGLAHQFKSQLSDVSFNTINTEITEHIIRAAIDAKVHHFVLISSVSVYGSHTTGVCTETTPCYPEGAYAQSKYQAEQRAIQIAQQSTMRLTILRLATVYGECDPGNVARLMRAIDRGRFVWIGTGTNRKSLIHCDDVARACIAVLQSSAPGIGIYNVSALPCTMHQVVQGLADALGKRLPSWYIPALPTLRLIALVARLSEGATPGRVSKLHATLQKWVSDDVYDGGKFEQIFQFHPQVPLEVGLQREVAWYRTLSKSR